MSSLSLPPLPLHGLLSLCFSIEFLPIQHFFAGKQKTPQSDRKRQEGKPDAHTVRSGSHHGNVQHQQPTSQGSRQARRSHLCSRQSISRCQVAAHAMASASLQKVQAQEAEGAGNSLAQKPWSAFLPVLRDRLRAELGLAALDAHENSVAQELPCTDIKSQLDLLGPPHLT